MKAAVGRKVNLTNLIKAIDLYNNEKESDRKAYIANRRNNKNIRSNPVLQAIVEGLEDVNPDYDPLDFIVVGLSRLRIWGVIDNIGHYDIITEGLNAYNVSRESNDFILYCLNDFERRKDFIEKYVTKEGYKRKEREISDYERQVIEDLENYTTGEQSSILSRLRLLFDDEVTELEKIESYYDKNESQLTVKGLFKNGEFNASAESLNEFFWRNQSIDKSSSLIDHFRNLSRYATGLMRAGIIRDKIRLYSESNLSADNQYLESQPTCIANHPIAIELNKYGFYELNSVKVHGNGDKLISFIIEAPKYHGLKRKSDKALGYKMAMINLLEFDKHVYHKHANNSKEEMFSILAKIFDAVPRTIKGHLNSLNPNSTDRGYYNAHEFVNLVTKDYQNR